MEEENEILGPDLTQDVESVNALEKEVDTLLDPIGDIINSLVFDVSKINVPDGQLTTNVLPQEILDENGNVIKGGSGDVRQHGEDVVNLQATFKTTEQLKENSNLFIDERDELKNKTNEAIDSTGFTTTAYDYKNTLENYIARIPVYHPDYEELVLNATAMNEKSIETTGVGLGYHTTKNIGPVIEQLQDINSGVSIIERVKKESESLFLDPKVPITVPNPLEETRVAQESTVNYNLLPAYLQNELALDNVEDVEKLLADEPPKEELSYDYLTGLTPEELDENFKLTEAAKDYMTTVLLDHLPAGSNMKDLFNSAEFMVDGELDYDLFTKFAAEKFSKIIKADPVLQAWQQVANDEIRNNEIQKIQEVRASITTPCAEKNDGVATADCLTASAEAVAQWRNTEYTRLYTNNKYVKANTVQYVIGFSKLMNKFAKPFGRQNVDVYRDLDEILERDGFSGTPLMKDALAKLGFGMEQTGGLINILYNNSGVAGDTNRKELMNLYNAEGFTSFAEETGLYDQAISSFRGGGGAQHGFGKDYNKNNNKINFGMAFNLVNGKILPSTQLTEWGTKDYYYADQVPGKETAPEGYGGEYVMHGGSGTLANRVGTIEITPENFAQYFPDGNVAATRMYNLHGKLYFSPINAQNFGHAKNIINKIDQWVVNGKNKNNFGFNQTAVAKMYGGTGWRYGDMTLRDVFEGKKGSEFTQEVESVLSYDIKQTGILLQNTTEMLTAEYNSGLALNPDTEFADTTSLFRHLVGQADTMIPMYVGGILQMSGKVVSKLPGYGKPIGYTMQGVGKVLTVLGTVNVMAKEFTTNLITSWRTSIMESNGGISPTPEEFIEMITAADSDSFVMKSLLGAAASGGMEKIGVDMMLKSPGGAIVASLYRKEIVKFIKQMPKKLLHTLLAAGGEGLTEGIQGWIHEMTVNWSLGLGLVENLSESSFDTEGFQVGWRIGLALPIPAAIVNQSSVEITQIGMDVASKLVLDPASSNNIFSPWAAANNFFTESITEIQNKIDNKTIPIEEGRSLIESLSNSRNLGMKIPTTMPIESRREYLELLVAQNQLQNKIKDTDNKEISEGDGTIQSLKDVNKKIIELTEQEVVRELYFGKVGKIDKIIEKNSDGKVKIFKEQNVDKVNARIEELKLDGWNIKKQNKNNANYGSIYQKGDNQVIILNEAEIVKDGKINTGAHEFLHAIIYQTVKNSKGTAIDLGKNLLQYIKKINPELLKRGEFKKRYETYKNADDVTDAVMGEEILTLFSEAVLDGAIEIDQGLGDTFKGIVRRIFQTFAPNSLGKIKFDDGKQIFNFIKDYNKSIEKGKLTAAQSNLLNTRAEGDLVKREYNTASAYVPPPKNSTAFDKTNKLIADEDFETTNRRDQKRAIEAAGPVIEATTKRLWRPDSLLSRDQFKKALENEYIQSLTEYDSDRDTGTGAGRSISNKFNLRANKVASDNITKKNTVSTDSERAQQVADTTEQKDFDEAQTQEGTQRKKVYVSQTNQVGDLDTAETKAIIKEEVSKDILLAAGKNKNVADTVRDIINQSKETYFKRLRKDVGTFSSKKYKDFVNSLDQNFIKSLPVGTIKRRFGKLFGIKQTGVTKTKQTSKTGKPSYFNKQVYNVPKVTNESLQKFKDYFLAGEKRQQSLYSILATDFALESIQELKSSTEFMGKLQTALGNEGITAQEFMQNVENKLDTRNLEDTSLDVVKANKKRIRITSDEAIDQLTKIALATDINKAMKIIDSDLSSKTTVTPENLIAKQEEMQEVLKDYNISEEAFLSAKFSNFARKKVGDVYVNEPRKGGLYYGVKDPAYIKALAQARKNKPITGKKATRVDAKKAGTNQANTQSDINLDILESVALELQAAVKGGMPIELAALFITSSYQATPGLVKTSGKIVGESINPQYAKEGKPNQTGGKEKYREEHSPPASVVGASIIWAIKNGQVKALFPYIRKNYIQVLLSKADDFLLDKNGFGSTLPEGVSILTDNAGIRRFAAAGINLNTIKDFKTGGSFADVMNVGTTNKASKKNPNIVYAQNSLISEQITDNLDGKTTQARIKAYEPIAALEYKASKKNTTEFGDKVNNEMTVAEQLTMLGTYDKAASKARDLNAPKKGISVFDFDDTLAKTKEKVIVNKADGSTTKISAAEFAEQASDLEAEGATFDFSNFDDVVNAKKGPLADLALKRQDKFGSKDIFVLTARPQIAATGIKKFLDGIGLNLPLANITGLENGTPGAKGNWVAQKAAEGYNDFYFADDAYKNVEAVQEVLSQVDVDSEVQIAKSSKKETFDTVMNEIIQTSTGIGSEKVYSKARGQTTGANKGRFTFFTTPSAEDMLGLVYKFLGKGKVGDAQLQFFKDNLFDPYNRAELSVTKAKITAAAAFKALKTNLKSLPKKLSKQTGIGGFTFSQAARVAAWTRQGMEVPGLSKRDVKELNKFVENNAELNTFVDELIKIQKGQPYPAPGNNWLGGNITSDILNNINKVNRKKYLQEWQQNVDIIFSDKNMNKLEAAFGPRYVEALRDQLARMKSGSNRPIGGSRIVNNVLDWLNNSVGAVMFLNTRSAVLQTISSVNFINWGDNNIYQAGKAFANQKQFWKDFMTLFNSPYLVERRDGLKINVSESEIADAVSEASNKPKAAISYLLNKGFIFTRIADSFAIASGGATFYRNRLEALVKGGMDLKAAEIQAFKDFYAIAEENQQSSNPSKISQQQASGVGRVILAFANTPMQYARIIKRSSQDLINGRGDWKSNVSKIVYYSAAQNLIFNALSNALFVEAFKEDDDEEDEKQANKKGRIANGMADSLLRGLGVGGAVVSTLKNALMTIANENNKTSPAFIKAVYDLFDFSPPLDSKFRKLRSGANSITWDRENMKNLGFDLNNPAYLAGAQIISGLTNIPLDRAIQKINNIRAIMSNSSQNWQKVALTLGWGTWDVGLPYYGVEDKVEMTPKMILKAKVEKMAKDTSTKEQKEMLLKLGLTKQEIVELRYEKNRVKKIIELQKKKNDAKN